MDQANVVVNDAHNHVPSCRMPAPPEVRRPLCSIRGPAEDMGLWIPPRWHEAEDRYDTHICRNCERVRHGVLSGGDCNSPLCAGIHTESRTQEVEAAAGYVVGSVACGRRRIDSGQAVSGTRGSAIGLFEHTSSFLVTAKRCNTDFDRTAGDRV